MSYQITSKGQVTLPKAVRDKLGLEPGEAVDFRTNAAGEVVVERAAPRKVRVSAAKFLGAWGPGPTTDEIMAMTRGEE